MLYYSKDKNLSRCKNLEKKNRSYPNLQTTFYNRPKETEMQIIYNNEMKPVLSNRQYEVIYPIVLCIAVSYCSPAVTCQIPTSPLPLHLSTPWALKSTVFNNFCTSSSFRPSSVPCACSLPISSLSLL